MSSLRFVRDKHQLTLYSEEGEVVGQWPAYNNVDGTSRKPWPAGEFVCQGRRRFPGEDADSAYGIHGIIVFDVPGRPGLGIHAGRANMPDGLGRRGPEHSTAGSIRTTEDAMASILAFTRNDVLRVLSVT